MPVVWKLKLDDFSPGQASFTMERQGATETYVPDAPATPLDVNTAILTLLGDVGIGSRKLSRVLPKCHPFYNWLFASQVDVQGFGNRDSANRAIEQIPIDFPLEADPITVSHVQYPRTSLRVTFTPRPFPVLRDPTILPTSFNYFDENGVTQNGIDSKEYQRFTDIEVDPEPQLLSAQHGQLFFRTGSNAAPGGIPPFAFSGFPNMVIPNGNMRVTWYHIPYSLALDTAHPMWTSIGKVNQRTFLNWPPGTLLYMGPKFRRYTPPVPAFVITPGGPSVSSEKVCDVQFQFLFTTRVGTDLPTPVNGNWIARGWNLNPYWKTRKFYYTTAGASPDLAANAQVPPFVSAPMELLFFVNAL